MTVDIIYQHRVYSGLVACQNTTPARRVFQTDRLYQHGRGWGCVRSMSRCFDYANFVNYRRNRSMSYDVFWCHHKYNVAILILIVIVMQAVE